MSAPLGAPHTGAALYLAPARPSLLARSRPALRGLDPLAGDDIRGAADPDARLAGEDRCRRSGSLVRRDDDPVLLRSVSESGGAALAHNRRAASSKTSRSGQADANASFTRRTLIVTSAPIFSSFSRIVPQVAVASLVPASPMRLTAHMST